MGQEGDGLDHLRDGPAPHLRDHNRQDDRNRKTKGHLPECNKQSIAKGPDEIWAGHVYPEVFKTNESAPGKSPEDIVVVEGHAKTEHGSIAEHHVPDKAWQQEKIQRPAACDPFHELILSNGLCFSFIHNENNLYVNDWSGSRLLKSSFFTNILPAGKKSMNGKMTITLFRHIMSACIK